MFISIARYSVALPLQREFVRDFKRFFETRAPNTPGLRRVRFLRSILEPTELGVYTEWATYEQFRHIFELPGLPQKRFLPHVPLDMHMYESVEDVEKGEGRSDT